MKSRSIRILNVFFSACALLAAPAARADGALDDAALFEKGHGAIAAGEHGAAIDAFEALADRGFLHPDASYDRGLAYVMRVRAGAGKPGDLGRAAAAFEEARSLSPGDRDAELALDQVRAEVTRRRARLGRSALDARPTIDRAIAGLVSDAAWTVASVVASCLLAAGILLRRIEGPAPATDSPALPETSPVADGRRKSGPAHPLHVTGTVLVVVSIFALLFIVPFAWHARTLRLTTRTGVVVAAEVHLTGEDGRALGGDAIPEAASVEVGERRGPAVHVRWGSAEGWAPAASIRVLP